MRSTDQCLSYSRTSSLTWRSPGCSANISHYLAKFFCYCSCFSSTVSFVAPFRTSLSLSGTVNASGKCSNETQWKRKMRYSHKLYVEVHWGGIWISTSYVQLESTYLNYVTCAGFSKLLHKIITLTPQGKRYHIKWYVKFPIHFTLPIKKKHFDVNWVINGNSFIFISYAFFLFHSFGIWHLNLYILLKNTQH